MSPDFEKSFSERTKQPKKPYFEQADDELNISHDDQSCFHRLVFNAKKGDGVIPVKSSIFFKLKAKMGNWQDNNLLTFWKNNCYTFGLSKNGKFVINVKSDLSVFPKEFLRSLRQDFKFEDYEIRGLIDRLNFVDLEVSHKINDPNGNLKNAKIKFDLRPLVEKLIAFTDESNGSLELELKGDPATCTNLEYLLKDKLHAVLFFAELTKIVSKLTDIQSQLFDSIQYISNELEFIIDDLIEKRFKKTEQTEQTEQKTEQNEVLEK